MIQAGLIPSMCNNLGGRTSNMYVFDNSVTDQQIHDAMANSGNVLGLPYLGSFNTILEPKSDGESYRLEVRSTSKAIIGSSFAYDARIMEGSGTLATAVLSDFNQYIVRRAPVRAQGTLYFANTTGVAISTAIAALPNPSTFAWVPGPSYPTAGSELLEDGITLNIGFGNYSGGNRVYIYPVVLDYGTEVTFDSFIRHIIDGVYGAGNKSCAVAAWVNNAWVAVTPSLRGDVNTNGLMMTKFTPTTARYWCIVGGGSFPSSSGGAAYNSYQYLKKFGFALSTDTVADMEPVEVTKAVIMSPIAGDTAQENTAIFSGQGYAIMTVGDPESVGADMIVAETFLNESRSLRLLECKIEVTDV